VGEEWNNNAETVKILGYDGLAKCRYEGGWIKRGIQPLRKAALKWGVAPLEYTWEEAKITYCNCADKQARGRGAFLKGHKKPKKTPI